MYDLRPCCCCDCQHYDPYYDEAIEECGHPAAPFPFTPEDWCDARNCPGFTPYPYAVVMEFLPLGGAIDV